MESAVKITNLSKEYNGKRVLKEISIDIKRGEIYGLVGPNGAGKTTIMKAILNLINKDGGKIEIFGKEINKGDVSYLSKIGSIIEISAFYNHLTVEKNLEIYCEERGFYDKERLEEIMKFLDIYKIKGKKAKLLSLGNKQRIGIAQAIAPMPEILILDEPVNALDPVGIKKVRDLLVKLSKEYGVSILISSHILAEVEAIADRVGFIQDGVVIEEKTMDTIRRKCEHHLEVIVNDSKMASIVLEKYFNIKNYKIIDENTLNIYDDNLDSTEVLKRLLENEIRIDGFSKKAENLEEYYIKMVGEK